MTKYGIVASLRIAKHKLSAGGNDANGVLLRPMRASDGVRALDAAGVRAGFDDGATDFDCVRDGLTADDGPAVVVAVLLDVRDGDRVSDGLAVADAVDEVDGVAEIDGVGVFVAVTVLVGDGELHVSNVRR